MPRGSELKAMVGWIKANVQDDEPFVLRFPRREAAKRIENKEKKREVRFRCDESTYTEFHIERERVLRELDENPTLFGLYLCEVLKAQRNEDVAAWKRGHEEGVPGLDTA